MSTTEAASVSFLPRIGRLSPDATAALVLAIVALAVRLPSWLGPLYGEWDAARLVVDGELWWKGGIRSAGISEYRYYISPGYVILAMGLSRVADLIGVHVGYLLNALNAVASVLFPVASYYLARRLTDRNAAFFGCLVLPFMPVVFWSGGYGFPSFLAVFALVCATLLYDRNLTEERWLGPRADTVLIIALLVGAALLKADMYLAAAAFPALYLYRRKWDMREILGLGAMLAIAPVVCAVTAKLLMSGGPLATEFFVEYQDQYKLHWSRAYSREYVEGWMMAFGFFSVPLAAIGWFRLVFERRGWLACALVVWAAAPFLWWYFRTGDSMRHHLPEAVPIAICIGLAVTLVKSRTWICWIAIVVVVAANYFRYPASGDGYSPSGRLFASLEIHRDLLQRFQQFGEEYAAVAHPRKVLLGTIGNPYADVAVLHRASRVVSATRGNPFGYDQIEYQFLEKDGSPAVSISARVDPDDAPAAAARYDSQGYAVFSFEHDLVKGRRDPRDLKSLQRFR